jgi:hypothetical protein
VRVKVIRPSAPYGGNAYIVESYRGRDGKPTSRTVEALGRVADLGADDPDWRAKADARAAALSAQKAASRGTVAYDLAESADPAGAVNIGWWLADAAWEALGLDQWLGRLRREAAWDQDVAGTLRLLTASRMLWPGSKRAAVAKAGRLMWAPEVSLHTVYKALDHVAEAAVKLQARARRAVAGDGERLERVFYDVTNYFFEIDQADPAGDGHDPARGTAARRKGCSKEHRTSPIIQMGLFMDRAGLPVAYRLFDGSTPDCSTMRGALSEFKEAFGSPHVTVVADAAMNNGPNLAQLKADGDDWVFAASIRKEPKQVRAWVLDPEGWTHLMGPDGTCSARVKSQVVTRTVSHKDADGREKRAEVTEKLVAKWSADYAARDRVSRAEMAAKAQALAADPARFKASGKRGVRKYVRVEQADPATGEVEAAVSVLCLDVDKLQADAELDGYWVLHSSRTGAPDWELLADYRQLWMIEDTFRVSKTDLEARPVYVWSPAHIEAHFACCFLALLAARLAERVTGLPVGRLRDLMGRLEVTEAGGGVYLVGRDADWDMIDKALGADTDRKWVTVEGLRAWRRDIAASFRAKLKTMLPT